MIRTLLAIAALTAALALPDAEAAAQTWRTSTASRALRGERQLAVDVEFAAGTFTLRPGGPSTLYRAATRYDETQFESRTAYDPTTHRLRLELTPRTRGSKDYRLEDESLQFLNVELPPAVPLELELTLGAAKSEIDLGGLSLQRAEITTGASKTNLRFTEANPTVCSALEISIGAAELSAEGLGNARCSRITVAGGVGALILDFSGTWLPGVETRAELSVGFGALALRLPSDIGVEVRMSRFLASFERSGFVKRGDRWISPNYDRATAKLMLGIRAVVGEITVEWLPSR